MPSMTQKDRRAAYRRCDNDDESNATSDDGDSGSDEDYEDDSKSRTTRTGSHTSVKGRPPSGSSGQLSRSGSRLGVVVSTRAL